MSKMNLTKVPWRVDKLGPHDRWIRCDTDEECNIPIAHIGANHREEVADAIAQAIVEAHNAQDWNDILKVCDLAFARTDGLDEETQVHVGALRSAIRFILTGAKPVPTDEEAVALFERAFPAEPVGDAIVESIEAGEEANRELARKLLARQADLEAQCRMQGTSVLKEDR